jgi:hypothetical protein
MATVAKHKEPIVYNECLTIHAHKWFANYQHLNSIEYLELNGGAIMAHFCIKYGVCTVLDDLDSKVEKLYA